MLPTLHDGRLIVLSGLFRAKAGAVVLVEHGGLEKVKRVRDITKDGIELRGDNPNRSTDSRHFGRVKQSAIIGVVVWPRTSRKR